MNQASTISHLRIRVDPAQWSPERIEQARSYALAQRLGKSLIELSPDLLPYLSPIIDRFSPVRLGHGGRMLRAWGKDYLIAESDAEAIVILVNGYREGTPFVGLPPDSFKGSQALVDGIIKQEGGMFWLEEPLGEKERPTFVITPEILSSKEYSERMLDDGKGKQLKPRKCTLALMCLHEHPGWTDQQIADAIGCDRGSLYRMKGFKKAKAAMRVARDDYKQWDQGENRWNGEE